MKFDYKKVLQEQNWFLAAGIVVVIYLIMLLLLHGFMPGEDALIKDLVHGMLGISALMVLQGFLDKRRKEELDAQRKRQRFETNKLMDKLRRRDGRGGGK